MRALVTGGSRGIGLATAIGLARAGYEVSIAARNTKTLSRAVAQAEAQGLSLRALSLDVADAASVAAGFAGLDGPLDVLVHAAGMGAYSDLGDPDDPARWHEVIGVNLNGAYHCARESRLRMPGPGRMVFVSSVLGLRGMRHSHAYCASKHGVIGLARSLALDLIAAGITVNAVCPGWVETEMARQDLAQMAARYALDPAELEAAEIAAVPLGRWIQADEVANMILWLVSPAAAAVTGQALEISGGL